MSRSPSPTLPLSWPRFAVALCVLGAGVWLGAPASANAAEVRCQGDRVVKGSATLFKVRKSGSTIYITRSGRTKGKAHKSGARWRVSAGGKTRASFDGRTIYKQGKAWGRVSDARSHYACPGPVAATLWVLSRLGAL